MISSKQKAKDLIFIAKKLMEDTHDLQVTELREVVRLYLKEFKLLKEPFLYKEDDDIITFCNEINKWYDKVYINLFDGLHKEKGFDARYVTTILKLINQIKDDINNVYRVKVEGTYVIDADKFTPDNKLECFEYLLHHNLSIENLDYEVLDENGEKLVDMCKQISNDVLLVRNDEKCLVKVVIKRNPFTIVQ